MSSHVQARGPGVWRIFIEDGRDPLTGHRRRQTHTFHGTRKEAEQEGERLSVAARAGGHGAAATTVGGLIDAWFAHAEPNLAAWTVRGYRSKIETHIRPALGDVKLKRLTTATLDAFYRELGARGKRVIERAADGTERTVEQPLSAQSVRHCHNIIRRAFEQGRRWGWVDRNPAELAEPPTVEHEHRALPPVTDIVRIVEKLDPTMRELVWLAIVTGARRGELCGLRWHDIDLETGQLTIARSVADIPDMPIVVKSTKTGKARRLALDGLTVAMLTARRADELERARTCEVELGALAYVFGPLPGAADPLRPALVTKRWSNAARAAGVRCRFHDLRHLAVTELLDAGFDVSGVSARVGHASAKMTLDQYGHTRRAGDLAAAEHLAGLIAPSRDPGVDGADVADVALDHAP